VAIARERVATEQRRLALWVFQAGHRASQLPAAFGGNPLQLDFEPVHRQLPRAIDATAGAGAASDPRAAGGHAWARRHRPHI
jgi:hypothetical protein